ncbi:MAG: RecX family transcriptional regulator [Candidatus Shapirobacteria bacterium]|jgi:SOS response regulatory protein OraA/RecX|nr:RecX family transcriptional regulator [Candidatus Shapirobacteria bacterium]
MISLVNIKTSRIKNRANLVFSDKNYLPFFIDDVIRLSLTKNQELSPEVLDQIKSLSLLYLGKEYALRQIAISPKTEKILFQKLKIFFYKKIQKFKLLDSTPTDSISNQIITELKDKQFLNQSDFVDYFLKKNKSKSVVEIKYLLNQKGVDTSSLNISPDNENQSIKKILSKKNINRNLLSDYRYKNKLYSSLFRRGFSVSDIKAAIDEYLSLQ